MEKSKQIQQPMRESEIQEPDYDEVQVDEDKPAVSSISNHTVHLCV